MIALLLIIKSKDTINFRLYKIKIYIIGFIAVIFLETSLKFITSTLLQNLIVISIPLLLFFILYLYFFNKLKYRI